MRIEELMIGDLVECIYYDEEGKEKSFYANISAIDSDSTLLDGTKAFLVEDSEVEEIDCCLPIPLTAEILEKNGFEKDDEMNFVIRGDDFFINLWIMPLCVEFYFKSYYDTNEMRINIDYVHELQQALRLVELNELANNFKI